jgi:hypothetical protein
VQYDRHKLAAVKKMLMEEQKLWFLLVETGELPVKVYRLLTVCS